MTEHVILVHGIWMRGIALLPLARHLRTADFSVEPFEYASVAGDPAEIVGNLTARIRAARSARVHLLGHSLGGLLALRALTGANDLPPGRAVCLGSPLRGSAAARGFASFPGGRWMMGRSLDVLATGLDAWDGRRAVGVIAGRVPVGFGFLVGALAGSNDGTVAVAETELPGISDHRVVAASHTGLLFSSEVADLCVAFLRTGRFPPAR
ncbi:MAG TPA: alpha/beta hydrolase [Rhodanobacteraceae bacterium]|nr:alpha/beta hydrolase [Rhodanobacteraceae bacterium]